MMNCFVCDNDIAGFDIEVNQCRFKETNSLVYTPKNCKLVTVDYVGPVGDPCMCLIYMHDKCWNNASCHSKQIYFESIKEWVGFAGKDWEPMIKRGKLRTAVKIAPIKRYPSGRRIHFPE